MNNNINTTDVWDREYLQIHSIPSSTRTLPSKAFCVSEPLIDFSHIKKVLDAGCGNGRNAVYLAKRGCSVTAVDFSGAALDATANLAAQKEISDRIKLAEISLFSPFPYKEATFDLCLDSYVSCHFIDKQNFRTYWNEMARVTRNGGFIFSSMFCDDDEYYVQYLNQEAPHTATDPTNQITKLLFKEDEFKSLFGPPLSIQNFLKFQFIDTVLGRNYVRSLLIAVLRKLAA